MSLRTYLHLAIAKSENYDFSTATSFPFVHNYQQESIPSRMRTAHFSDSKVSSYRDFPGQRPPPAKEHGARGRDPLEGTWDQAARQELISYRTPPPPRRPWTEWQMSPPSLWLSLGVHHRHRRKTHRHFPPTKGRKRCIRCLWCARA